MKRVVFSLLLAALGQANALAQVETAAATRVIGPPRGTADPAFWLGASLRLRQAAWGGELSLAGGPRDGRLGGEGSGTFWIDRNLNGAVSLAGNASVAGDEPVGWAPSREASGRLGVGLGSGPFRFAVGGLGLTTSLGGSAVGGFGEARLRLGPLELIGDINELRPSRSAHFLGRIPVPGTDTGGIFLLNRLGYRSLRGRLRAGPLEFAGRVIRRTELSQGGRDGWEVAVGVEPGGRIRLEVAAGHVPLGQSLLLPVRRHLSLGVSMVPRRLDRPTGGGVGETTFRLVRRSQTSATVLVRAPGAQRVEITGDFTDWLPVPLAVTGPGEFSLELPLSPGVYLVNIAVDGGGRIVPPGLDAVDDGFGGRAGVLVVN